MPFDPPHPGCAGAVPSSWRGLLTACALALLATASVCVPACRNDREDRGRAAREEPSVKGDKKPARLQPKILNVEEAQVTLARVQVRGYLLRYDERSRKTYAYAIEGKRLRLVDVNKLRDEPLATQIQPLRMAVIAAAFPYLAQVREFRDKLGLRSEDEVLAEATFHFLGVTVERRELDGDDRPLAGKEGQWRKLDLGKDIAEYAFATGRDFEPEDRELAPVTIRGLVMPRLRQARAPAKQGEGDRPPETPDQYPAIERNLNRLSEALEKLCPPSTRFGDPEGRFDPFGGGEDKQKGDARPRKRLPEHCLVRVVDVTVQPGRAYEYRLKVRMADPNQQRKGEADARALESAEWSPQRLVLRVDPELCYYAVDQEAIAKARDPNTKYSDAYSKSSLSPDRATFFQAQRWVERARLPCNRLLFGLSGIPARQRWFDVVVGEWVVAERFPVYRGEYVGRTERVKLPRWKPGLEDFVLTEVPSEKEDWARGFNVPDTPKKGKVEPGVPFEFGHERQDGRETVLVDFDSGRPRHVWVKGAGKGRAAVRRIEDAFAGEALLLSPDGKLLLRETVLDAADRERSDRAEAARQRIKAIEDRDKPAGKGKGKKFGD